MVSIIILSYNTKDLLQSCLQSIFENLSKKEYEVIVVDNASMDKSVEMVEDKFPSVKLIKNSDNLGFAAGINIGAVQAKGEFLLFLNSDTKVLDTSIDRMKEHFLSYKKLAVVGGLLNNPDGSIQRSFGKFYTLPQTLLMLTFGDKGEIFQQSQAIAETDWVSGGFMLIKKDVFEEIGGFDENFFMYVEDMELCYRVRKHHHKVVIDPTIRVEHVGHGSSNRTFAIVHIYKGILYFYQKHRSKLSVSIVKYVLLLKAYAAIMIGNLTRNSYLTQTYKKALEAIL